MSNRKKQIIKQGSIVLAGVLFLVLVFESDRIIGGTAAELQWKDLQQLNYATGEAPSNLKSRNDKVIKIGGYPVPVEGDDWENVTEFLLVPDPMACIHVPPPPPNQIVHVKLKNGISFEELWGAIKVTGTFKIVETKSVYGASSFYMGRRSR